MATARIAIDNQPVTTNRFQIVVRKVFLKDLQAWFDATRNGQSSRSRSLNEFLSMIVEAKLAEFRSLRIPPKREDGVFREKDEPAPVTKYDRRNRFPFSAEQVQAILHLRIDEDMSDAQIAARFSCSRTTIARIFAEFRKRGKHNSYAIQPSAAREHGTPEWATYRGAK